MLKLFAVSVPVPNTDKRFNMQVQATDRWAAIDLAKLHLVRAGTIHVSADIRFTAKVVEVKPVVGNSVTKTLQEA